MRKRRKGISYKFLIVAFFASILCVTNAIAADTNKLTPEQEREKAREIAKSELVQHFYPSLDFDAMIAEANRLGVGEKSDCLFFDSFIGFHACMTWIELASSTYTASPDLLSKLNLTPEDLSKAREVAKPINFDALVEKADSLGVDCSGDFSRSARINLCGDKVVSRVIDNLFQEDVVQKHRLARAKEIEKETIALYQRVETQLQRQLLGKSVIIPDAAALLAEADKLGVGYRKECRYIDSEPDLRICMTWVELASSTYIASPNLLAKLNLTPEKLAAARERTKPLNFDALMEKADSLGVCRTKRPKKLAFRRIFQYNTLK